MYAVHKGYYTSLCMYLTARDVLLLRLDQGRTVEAQKIYEALKRLIPSIEDKDGQVARFMEYAARRLEEAGMVLNRGQQAVLDCIRSNPGLRVPMISEGTNIPSKSIERHVSALIARNLIEHRGSKKTGGYYAK